MKLVNTSATVLLVLVLARGARAALPAEFKWCATTAGNVVEGKNVKSDWWKFEFLRKIEKRSDETSGDAAHVWKNEFSEALDAIKYLGLTAFRFSVEWSRVEPTEGTFDESAIQKYAAFIRALEGMNVEPIVTLSNYSLPAWFQEEKVKGKPGWLKDNSPTLFEGFVKKVRAEIAPKVKTFITFQEPMTHVLGGYVGAETPPVRKGPVDAAMRPFVNVLKAHILAYKVLKSTLPGTQVGIAHHFREFTAKPGLLKIVEQQTRDVVDQVFNWTMLDALETGTVRLSFNWLAKMADSSLKDFTEVVPGLKGTEDFLAVNYYTSSPICPKCLTEEAEGKPVSQETRDLYDPLKWENKPIGLRTTLMSAVARIKKARGKMIPILISENGTAADSSAAGDVRREKYLRSHVAEISALRTQNSADYPLIGYCYYSLLDGFEWTLTTKNTFGLFKTNFLDGTLKPRALADHYKKIIEDLKPKPTR